jgi:hypothetical protein
VVLAAWKQLAIRAGGDAVNHPFMRALCLGAATAAVGGLLHWSGVGLWLLLGLAMVVGAAAWVVPFVGVHWLDDATLLVRSWFWAREQGRFYSFGGVPLAIEDDGRFVWVNAADLQRALQTEDREDVIAARHAGRWQRDERGELLLRVDAVVQYLATRPGRAEPRTVRLRRYFEREVLFPAIQRRERR